jgi:hypothetical protein
LPVLFCSCATLVLMNQHLPALTFPALLLTSLLLPLSAAASTLYKCTDDSGVVLYTNQKTEKKNCIIISVQVPPPPKGNADAAGTRPAKASATPTPSDFPRVSSTEQKSRDTDRRAILERELATEQAALDKAKQTLTSAGAKPPQATRDAITLHERNVEALNKELAKLR